MVQNLEPVPFAVGRDPLGASALGVVDPTLLEEIASAPVSTAAPSILPPVTLPSLPELASAAAAAAASGPLHLPLSASATAGSMTTTPVAAFFGPASTGFVLSSTAPSGAQSAAASARFEN